MAKRKALGNAVRFKILQRDGFRCQYCGRTPPAVVLHVDHVVAVADGGGNDEENLVAACSDCNHGKFTRAIEAESVPRDFKAMAQDARERAAQLREYRAQLKALRQEVDEAIDFVGEAFWGKGSTWNYERGGKSRTTVERYLSVLGLDSVAEAARIAYAKFPPMENWRSIDEDRFKYFCGICRNWSVERGRATE